MTTWTGGELARIGAADELELAALRRDGTLRKPVTIWVVRHGDDLYVRSVNGRTSSWFRGAADRHEAHIHAGGVDKDVLLVEMDDFNDEIDAASECPFEGLWSVGAHFDGVPLPSQCASEGLGDGRVVLGEQY